MKTTHNRLNANLFYRTYYANAVSKVFDLDYKKKNDSKQFKMIYDTLNTLIDIYNEFFTTHDKSTNIKITNSIDIISKYLDAYFDEIDKCYDKHCIYLKDEFMKWQNILDEYIKQPFYSRDKEKITLLKASIEKEMKKLEYVNFDFIIDDNNNYYEKKSRKELTTKYYCKLTNTIESEQQVKNNENEFKKIYYDNNGINLDDEKELYFKIWQTFYYIDKLHNLLIDIKLIGIDKFIDNHQYVVRKKKENVLLEDIINKLFPLEKTIQDNDSIDDEIDNVLIINIEDNYYNKTKDDIVMAIKLASNIKIDEAITITLKQIKKHKQWFVKCS